MQAFMAELAARPNTSQFISRFGSESYYAHGTDASGVDETAALMARIDALDLDGASAQAAAEQAAECASCGSGCGGCC